MSIIWKKEYSMGIKEIDDQHQYFVSIINSLLDAINERRVAGELNTIINKLYDYAVFHFKTEEKYFDFFNYEGATEHKLEHIKPLGRVQEFKDEKKEDPWALAFRLADFLEDWLIDHLANMDKKYVACFHEHGLN